MFESLHTQYCYDHKMYVWYVQRIQLSTEIRIHKSTTRLIERCLFVWQLGQEELRRPTPAPD